MEQSPSRLLHLLLAEQREGWRNGKRLRVENYLDRYPALRADADGLLDLVNNEVILRSRGGETPRIDEYVERFPTLASQIRCMFEVHGAIEGPPPRPEPPADRPLPTDDAEPETMPAEPPPPGGSD